MAVSVSDNRGPELTAVTIVFITLSIAGVALRLYTRLRLLKWIGVDDVFILFALAAAIAQGVSGIIAIKYGLGKHVWQLNLNWLQPCGITVILNTFAYVVAVTSVKISILSFYLRLSPDRLFRNLTYTVILICALFGIGTMICTGLQCIPLSELWYPTSKGRCMNFRVFVATIGAIHISTEILIYALPLHVLWKLQMPFRQKLALICLLSIGIVLIGISSYRLVLTNHLAKSWDKTWELGKIMSWQIIEVNVAILVASGPSLVAFTKHHFPAVFGSSKSRQPRYSARLEEQTGQSGTDAPIHSTRRAAVSTGQRGASKLEVSEEPKWNNQAEARGAELGNSSEDLIRMRTMTEDGYITGEEDGIKKVVEVEVKTIFRV